MTAVWLYAIIDVLRLGGELGSTGQVEVEAACPGCQEAW